jgi:hypothetical protein
MYSFIPNNGWLAIIRRLIHRYNNRLRKVEKTIIATGWCPTCNRMLKHYRGDHCVLITCPRWHYCLIQVIDENDVRSHNAVVEAMPQVRGLDWGKEK